MGAATPAGCQLGRCARSLKPRRPPRL